MMFVCQELQYTSNSLLSFDDWHDVCEPLLSVFGIDMMFVCQELYTSKSLLIFDDWHDVCVSGTTVYL